jgi:hypothetical protein
LALVRAPAPAPEVEAAAELEAAWNRPIPEAVRVKLEEAQSYFEAGGLARENALKVWDCLVMAKSFLGEAPAPTPEVEAALVSAVMGEVGRILTENRHLESTAHAVIKLVRAAAQAPDPSRTPAPPSEIELALMSCGSYTEVVLEKGVKNFTEEQIHSLFFTINEIARKALYPESLAQAPDHGGTP